MIIQTQPEETKDAPVALVFSDAGDNDSAIREIDRWAREHEFVRSTEHHLGRRQRADGRMLFFGSCYRLDDDYKRAARTDLESIRARRRQMPVTTSSDVLVRDE